MYKRILAVSIVLLVAMALPTKNQTSKQIVVDDNITTANTETTAIEIQQAETPLVEHSITWKDNPNNCDQTKQYISAEAPFNCIDKPVQQTKSLSKIGNCDLVYNYNWDTSIAYQICSKESGGNVLAVNWSDNHGKCVGSFSLMQVACFWYTFYGYSSNDYYNATINVDIAYKIWLRQGNSFRAWTTCKLINGCY